MSRVERDLRPETSPQFPLSVVHTARVLDGWGFDYKKKLLEKYGRGKDPHKFYLEVVGSKGVFHLKRSSIKEDGNVTVVFGTRETLGGAWSEITALGMTNVTERLLDYWRDEQWMDVSGVDVDSLVIMQLQGNNLGGEVLPGVQWPLLLTEIAIDLAQEADYSELFLLPAKFTTYWVDNCPRVNQSGSVRDIQSRFGTIYNGTARKMGFRRKNKDAPFVRNL